MYHIFFIHSSIDRFLVCFKFLTIMNKAAMSKCLFSRLAKAIFNNKITAQSITLPGIKLCCRGTILKQVWHKNRPFNQWSEIQDPDKIYTPTYI